MAITTLDGLIASTKRQIVWQKTASRTTVANIPFSVFDQAGQPGAGTITVGNTTTGIVPTDATTGYPNVVTPSGTLYMNTVQARSSVAGWIDIYDCLFSAGAFNFSATVTLSTQPSYSSRLPGGSYANTELWLEAAAAMTGNQSIRIQYLDQDGGAGDTGTVATGIAPILGRMYLMPLAAGDSGVSQVNVITSNVSTAGTFNVHVMRWLWGCRINAANQGVADNMFRTGLIQIYGDSALRGVITADSTASGLPSVRITTADG